MEVSLKSSAVAVSTMKVLDYLFSERFEKYFEELMIRSGFDADFHPHEGLANLLGNPAYARFENGVIHVYLKTGLSDELAEVLAAHEITEPILTKVEGYPNCYITNLALGKGRIFEDIGSRITSAVLNAIVNERLREHGFDVDKLIEELVVLLKTLPLQMPPDPPPETLIQNALIYLDHYLSHPSLPEIERLTEYFREIGGEQWKLIVDLTAVVKETGYRTIDQSLDCMIRIRDRLNLSPYILIHDTRDYSLH